MVENKHTAAEAAELFGIGLRTVFEDLYIIQNLRL
jgi:hypothetical protein